MKKTKTKCYLYTRVSTSMQVDGYSLDAQRDKLRKYAEYEDMVVAGEYSDEGFSGKNIQGRHEFQRMLQDIQDCKDGVEYVLVFKLSRFGRNAADVLNSLQLMQDFGVNLICVEDGIDSSKDSGKLMISVLSAVAEIERENIRTQTMAGREQKAREGKWNGGFAPYGYRLEKGELLIAEDEVDVIRTIFDRYIHTNDGVSGVAKYLNRQGFVKKLRQNGTIPGFSASFVKSIIDNPVYMGKIAYGRRRTEKKIGTRNEMHVVEQSEFPVYEGKHEAIISEEDWNLAQEKRKINAYRREKVNDPTHAHILSGILECPCCGKSLYGNIAKAHSKDKKTRYYYYCKNTVTPTGHECTFRLNIEQMEMNRMVASIISAMVSDPRFADAIKAKIGSAVDTNDLEKQLEALQAQLRQTLGTKARLERQMDGLDVNDPYYDRKISDLQRRYDEQYGAIDEIEVQIDDVQSQIRSIRQEKISGDNIYRLLLAFDQVYEAASEVERKEFMRAFIERIELFPEKQPDGNWIRKIIFNFPVPVNGTEVKELPLENETIVETVTLLNQIAADAQANNEALLSINERPFYLVPSVPMKGLTADENIKIITALIVSDEIYSEFVNSDTCMVYWNFCIPNELVETKGLMLPIMEARDLLKPSGLYYESYLNNFGRQLFYVISGSYTTLYMGFMFLIIACALLALQFLTQMQTTKSRYLTLSILGARREQIKRSINQQVLWYFLLPLILACISGAVGIYAMQLYLYSGAAHLEQSYPLLIAMAVIVVLVMVIYGVAVARTANREIGKLNYKPNS